MLAYIAYLRKHPERHGSLKFKMPLPRFMPWLVLVFFAFIVVTLTLADDTRFALLCTPVWFIGLAVMWQVRKRALIRDGLPLTAAIPLPGTGEDAQDQESCNT